MFYSWCYSFILPQHLRAPLADRRQTLTHDRYMTVLYKASPKFWALPPKKFGAKNLQNLGRFYTTANIDPKCLRNESRYPKSERNVIKKDPFGEKSLVNFGPLSRKYNKWLWTHPKIYSSEDYILAIRLRGATPQIFTHTTDWQRCLCRWTWGAGQPQVLLCPIFLVLIVLLVGAAFFSFFFFCLSFMVYFLCDLISNK